jgi:hypothetical protein
MRGCNLGSVSGVARLLWGGERKMGESHASAKTFSVQFTPFSNACGESQKKSKKSEIYQYLGLQ